MKKSQVLVTAAVLLTLFTISYMYKSNSYAAVLWNLTNPDWNNYDVTIQRDNWGIPTIIGERDVDVAFGYGYVHATDAMQQLEFMVLEARGNLSLAYGKDFLKQDTITALLSLPAQAQKSLSAQPAEVAVGAASTTRLSSDTIAYIEAYAQGINLWAYKHPQNITSWIYPVTAQDIVAIVHLQHLNKMGVIDVLHRLSDPHHTWSPDDARWYEDFEAKSYSIAITPAKSWGATTLATVAQGELNAGPYWYPVRLRSDENITVAGMGFIGAPFLSQGFTSEIAWSSTDNNPRVFDIYPVEVRDREPELYYRGSDLEYPLKSVKINIETQLIGAYTTVESALFLQAENDLIFKKYSDDNEPYYVGLALYDLLQANQLEQWHNLNKAQTLQAVKSAWETHTIPHMNFTVVNADGALSFLYNAELRNKFEPDLDPQKTQILQKIDSADLPKIDDPSSGYLVVANQSPFQMTDSINTLPKDQYPEHWGIESDSNNRSVVLLEKIARGGAITQMQLRDFVNDTSYHNSYPPLLHLLSTLEQDYSYDSELTKAQSLLSKWPLRANSHIPASALAVCQIENSSRNHQASNQSLHIEEDVVTNTLRDCIAHTYKSAGALDAPYTVQWQMPSSDQAILLDVAPDTPRHGRKIVSDKYTRKTSNLAPAALRIEAPTMGLWITWDERGTQEVSLQLPSGVSQVAGTTYHSNMLEHYSKGQYIHWELDAEGDSAGKKGNVSSLIKLAPR